MILFLAIVFGIKLKFLGLNKLEFHRIFKNYYQMLCRFAYIILQSKDTADEIVQQTFIFFWENENSIQINKNIKSYLYKTVKNNALNHLKSTETRKKYENEYIARLNDTPLSELDDTVFKEKLKHAISELPERCRIVYSLKYLEGLTYDEIADYLSISSNTVNNHIQKALKILKEKLYPFREEFYQN